MRFWSLLVDCHIWMHTNDSETNEFLPQGMHRANIVQRSRAFANRQHSRAHSQFFCCNELPLIEFLDLKISETHRTKIKIKLQFDLEQLTSVKSDFPSHRHRIEIKKHYLMKFLKQNIISFAIKVFCEWFTVNFVSQSRSLGKDSGIFEFVWHGRANPVWNRCVVSNWKKTIGNSQKTHLADLLYLLQNSF